MRSRTLCLHAVALILVFAPLAAPAQAPESADHAQLRALAERHALAQVASLAPDSARLRAEAARLDPRLRLPACAQPPETFDPPGQRPGANQSIGIRCHTGAGWTLYIPVRVEMLADVVVLAAAAARGTALTSAHVRLESHDLAQLNGGWLTDPNDAVGMVLRRPVRPGTVLTSSVLERPKLVRRGERVRVVSSGGGFAVATEGEALNDAAEGERVRVRNVNSRSIIEGRMAADGQVVTAR
ncbi:MAG: flagellar basal body P-ring formation protein FlgA [Gammaproteobacteria bacterium]|nr:flagellar basal body P-ring formation protein FlgA [Gammaproteobacteria bacterium]